MSRLTHDDDAHFGTQDDTTVLLSAGIGSTSAGDPLHDALVEVESGVSALEPNPMTMEEDLIVGGVGGTPTRLEFGAEDQVLKVDGTGTIVWADMEGAVNPMTTIGDLVVGGASGTPARLPTGAVGRRLAVLGGSPGWVTNPSNYMPNPMTTEGDLIKGGASGLQTRLAVGSESQWLGVAAGAPAWVDPAGFDIADAPSSPTVEIIRPTILKAPTVVDLGAYGAGRRAWISARGYTRNAGPFGTGADGDLVLDGPSSTFDYLDVITNMVVVREAHFHNLVLINGAQLRTGGERIFVSGTLYIGDNSIGGLIHANGNNGANGGNGTATGGGGGGAAGTSLTAGTIGVGMTGQAGGAGGVVNGNGSPGAVAVSGAWDSFTNEAPRTQPAAGTGENADAPDAFTGGAGGGSAAWTSALTEMPFVYPNSMWWRKWDQSAYTANQLGGRGASGGGGAGASNGRGGGGGGSGSAGGIVIICARKIAGYGTPSSYGISAIGGAGGNGGVGFGRAGNGGGGCGGNGGFVVLIYGDATEWFGDIGVQGGSGGTGGASFATTAGSGFDGRILKTKWG